MAGPPAQHDRPELRRIQPDGALLICGKNLRLRVMVLKPGLVLTSARGEVVDAEDVRAEAALLSELELELERSGSLMLFADLRESPRMPAASRDKIAHWIRRHQTRLAASHVLVHSKLLEMALSIITMLVGGGVFSIHTNAQTFLGLLKKQGSTLAKLPVVPE